jgi:hypothetical protein
MFVFHSIALYDTFYLKRSYRFVRRTLASHAKSFHRGSARAEGGGRAQPRSNITDSILHQIQIYTLFIFLVIPGDSK